MASSPLKAICIHLNLFFIGKLLDFYIALFQNVIYTALHLQIIHMFCEFVILYFFSLFYIQAQLKPKLFFFFSCW